MSDFEQFSQIPCVTFQQTNPSNQSEETISITGSHRQQSQSYEYLQYIRQRAQQELKRYLKLLIVKTIIFGLMIGIFILVVFYDKLFFSYHYYMRTREYLTGNLGLDFNKLSNKNMANHEFGSGLDFNIKGINGYSNWDPMRDSPTSYHESNKELEKDKYDLEGYIMEELILKDFKYKQNIDQYVLAARLLEVTHNVDFKGQLKVQKTKYQQTDLDLKKKGKRIQKILKIEKNRYQTKYQIGKYIDNQLPFCLVIPSYNNVKSRLYLRNLDSIFMQQYSNYHVVYIDDASPDKTGDFVNNYIEEKNIPKDKIKVIINKENLFAMANLYTGITQHCKSGEIVMLLDGDDAFLGRQVMALFNAVYQKNKAAVVYSRYFVVSHNDRGGIGGSSRQIPHESLQNGKFRELKGFFTSHLLTFYADLFWKIKTDDLKYDNGTFFKFAYDVALITPIIQMVGTRIKFIEESTYEYRFDTGINDPGWGQMQVDEIVFSRPKYKKLAQFPFIDEFYEKKENKEQASKS